LVYRAAVAVACLFVYHALAASEVFPLSLHDALPISLFVLGYLAVWVGFAAVATTLQWGLDEAGLMSDTMGLANQVGEAHRIRHEDRKSTRLNSSHVAISYAVFCLKKKMENDSGGRRG